MSFGRFSYATALIELIESIYSLFVMFLRGDVVEELERPSHVDEEQDFNNLLKKSSPSGI